MTVALSEWSRLMTDAMPVDNDGAYKSEHKYICWEPVSDGVHSYTLLSKEELEKPHPGIQRYYLPGLYKKSKELINTFKERNQTNRLGSALLNSKVITKITDFVHTFPFEQSSRDFSKELQYMINDEIKVVKNITSSLKAMSDRASWKMEQQKVKSIWGKIKWFIWRWCCDWSQEIKKLDKTIPSEKQTIKHTCNELKERIWINMDEFVKRINHAIEDNETKGQSPTITNSDGSTTLVRKKFDKSKLLPQIDEDTFDQMYISPSAVKKEFILKYAPDKYKRPKNCDGVEDYYNRIVTLTQAWDYLMKENDIQTEKKPEPVEEKPEPVEESDTSENEENDSSEIPDYEELD